MKKLILMFATVAALMMSCQPEEEKAGSLSGEGYQFNFTIAPGGFDTATKGDATVGWTAGEKVYVFFKPEGGELLGDSYAAFTYTGSGWDPESYVAPGALGSSGKMAAVYVPYFSGKSPVYAGGKWTFDSGDVYYSCASGADYTVEGGTVTGTLDMTIPDGYVQFSIASAAEGDVLACNMVDGYEKVTLTSDLAFSTSPVTGKKMKGHADNGKTYFWGKYNGATATECEFTLTISAGDMVLKVLAENVLKNKAFNIASSFAPAPLTGVLPGEFSVSATKKVKFSKGNLYYDGSKFNFETNQYDVQNSWSTNHISHFYWSKTASVAYAASYSESGPAVTDVFFTNATAETAKSDFTVNGVTGKYRTLSEDEWTYLFDTRTVNGGQNEGKSYQRATINSDATGVYGMILYPDNYTSQTSATSYTSTEWTTMEENGCVFLPAAGYHEDPYVNNVGNRGIYWLSTTDNIYFAYDVYFSSGSSVGHGGYGNRDKGYSVRLVTEVK